jgi:hypothetical protein
MQSLEANFDHNPRTEILRRPTAMLRYDMGPRKVTICIDEDARVAVKYYMGSHLVESGQAYRFRVECGLRAATQGCSAALSYPTIRHV